MGLALLAACSGGGTDTTPGAGEYAPIPAGADLIYEAGGIIYTARSDGSAATPITRSAPADPIEHVAADRGRRYVVYNTQPPDPSGEAGGRSQLWLIDLRDGTLQRLVPGFHSAGNGGVDIGPDGWIYFAGKERNPFPEPRTRDELLANAGANDVYRLRLDGSAPERIVATPERGEADVSVAEDGAEVTFMAFDLATETTQIWRAAADGSELRLVVAAGRAGEDSVHDPEFSPDRGRIVFSRVNDSVPPNFPDLPGANTAHDLWVVDASGAPGSLRRLTRPGPISIVPDWRDDLIVYFEISEAEGTFVDRVIRDDAVDGRGAAIPPVTELAKWLPR